MCLIIIKKLINNIISMNDSMSILLATTILALGGLGLYVYRTNHEEQNGGDNVDDDKEAKYGEESIFSSVNLFKWGGSEEDNDKDEDVIVDEELEENEVKTRKRNNVKTQRNRKPSSSSRRRYY
jgi:hypothetical protein